MLFMITAASVCLSKTREASSNTQIMGLSAHVAVVCGSG